ncbi:MAG TPA: DNA double-strand break repair nuclease NurA [Tissierellaceae bacterium]|nr:DNA double-strand break repair nuclease NurA [Tissierellaceae bacterium]
MYSLSDKLKERVTDLNQVLKTKYDQVLNLNKSNLRRFIKENIGTIKSMEKLDNKHLALYEAKGGIVGVDGSNNRIGGAYPHFVEAYQGLAKSTLHKNEPLILADIYSPLNPEQEENPLEDDENIVEETRNIKLATIEVEVALASIERFRPYAIMMDGGLIRYNIYAYDRWMELRNKCEDEGILLIGVIKDIKTSIIGDKMRELNPNMEEYFYDKELLFGQLSYGELILIDDQVNKKSPEGYASAFLRSSLAPNVIGMDILDSQKQHMEEMARLVFTLTPENSRGVPLWLDMIDKEVKISDEIMKALMERYMDRGIYERFFVSERDRRN